VDLQADVFAERRMRHPLPEGQSHLVGFQVEARRDLGTVLVQPLCGDVQVDTGATGIRQRQGSLQAEERLILHRSRTCPRR
jgi:hypothetical protein